MIRERVRSTVSGFLVLAVVLVVMVITGFGFRRAAMAQDAPSVLAWVAVFAVSLVVAKGVFILNPNEGKVLQLFGAYRGTARTPGLRWANPFYTKARISLRVRNFESARLKVNDTDGNPIEIAAVVVWRVADTYSSLFEVENFENFVAVQSDSALRHLAKAYPYDEPEGGTISLRGSTDEVSDALRQELQERLSRAGVIVDEARLSHLAYAPEIANAMLQRQQAEAIIAARKRIVEGAVSMVEMALDQLGAKRLVQLDEERKAQMVSNLLVVLTSERVTPVINAGTLYS